MVNNNEGFLGFRSYPTPESSDGMLSEYLGSLESQGSKKDLMLRSIRCYWLPLALKSADVAEEQLQLEGYNAVWELLKQAKYICKALHLDPVEAGIASPTPVGGSAVSGIAVAPAHRYADPCGIAPQSAVPTSTPAGSATAVGEGEEKEEPMKDKSLGAGINRVFSGFSNLPVNPVD